LTRELNVLAGGGSNYYNLLFLLHTHVHLMKNLTDASL